MSSRAQVPVTVFSLVFPVLFAGTTGLRGPQPQIKYSGSATLTGVTDSGEPGRPSGVARLTMLVDPEFGFVSEGFLSLSCTGLTPRATYAAWLSPSGTSFFDGTADPHGKWQIRTHFGIHWDFPVSVFVYRVDPSGTHVLVRSGPITWVQVRGN